MNKAREQGMIFIAIALVWIIIFPILFYNGLFWWFWDSYLFGGLLYAVPLALLYMGIKQLITGKPDGGKPETAQSDTNPPNAFNYETSDSGAAFYDQRRLGEELTVTELEENISDQSPMQHHDLQKETTSAQVTSSGPYTQARSDEIPVRWIVMLIIGTTVAILIILLATGFFSTPKNVVK